jgi:hypothetical protein
VRLVELLKNHTDELGDGISSKSISDFEARLSIKLPEDFKGYLKELNYAEVFGDPIYGLNSEDTMIDLYAQNKNKEHFRHGFLEIFSNDIDGTIYIRPDTGAVYNAAFDQPLAKSFADFIEIILNQG